MTAIAPLDDGVEVTTPVTAYRCRRLVLAADAWTNRLLAPLGLHLPLTLMQEQVTYYAAPHLAHPERAADLPGEPASAPLRLFGDYADLAPHGYTGAPSQGSAEEGAAIVAALAAQVVPYLRKLDANDWRPGAWMYEG